MDELKRFLASIDVDYQEELENMNITKVILNKIKEEFDVYLENSTPIAPEIMENIISKAKTGINHKAKCNVHIKYDNITSEDITTAFNYIFQRFIEKKPSLIGLKETKITLDEDILIIDVNSKVEEEIINENARSLVRNLQILGFNDLNITTSFNAEQNAMIKQEIIEAHEANKPAVVKEENPVFIGKHIDGELTKIDDIVSDVKTLSLRPISLVKSQP